MIYPGESSKARDRRLRDGFFEKFCNGKGIDIGCGNDPLTEDCDKWDFLYMSPDATYMEGIPDNTYDFVYASHCLEHLDDPELALKNWFRITKPGGHMIVSVPHRDLYEKKRTLPSRWNYGHKLFFLLDRDDPPSTFGLVPMIVRALENYRMIYAKECSDGWEPLPPDVHSTGEYAIEIVIKKLEK